MLTLLRIISLKPLNHVKVILILEETLVILDIRDYLILLIIYVTINKHLKENL